MSIPENAPQWLKDARTENADVEITLTGYVIWKSGRFLDGHFLGGSFEGGSFEGGSFWGGSFLDGHFLGGSFEGGSFEGGSFWGGRFLDGRFLGGSFEGGSFEGGSFEGGSFLDGRFLGGRFWGGDLGEEVWKSIISKWQIIFKGGIVKIGCKEKTIKEWDKWFKSKEIFETPRGKKIFKMIQAHYEATKTYMKFMDKK